MHLAPTPSHVLNLNTSAEFLFDLIEPRRIDFLDGHHEPCRVREHPARIGDEHLEQGELGARQADGALAAMHFARRRIQREVGEGHDRRLGLLLRSGATQQRT